MKLIKILMIGVQVAPYLSSLLLIFPYLQSLLTSKNTITEWIRSIRALNIDVTTMQFERSRKRGITVFSDYAWSSGDQVDVWVQDR